MQLGGYSEMAITTFEAPSELPHVVKGLTAPDEHNFFRHTELASDAITINDDADLTREEREEGLTRLFEEHGMQLVFVGEYQEKPPEPEE